MAKKYIDAGRLKEEINKRKKSLRAGICGEAFTRKQKNEMLVASEELDRFNRIIDSLQPEQPEQDYPSSTEMITEWETNELPMLREKDFRGDAERMAYNAFLDGFAKGLGYKK